jgi:hypothetical protein
MAPKKNWGVELSTQLMIADCAAQGDDLVGTGCSGAAI